MKKLCMYHLKSNTSPHSSTGAYVDSYFTLARAKVAQKRHGGKISKKCHVNPPDYLVKAARDAKKRRQAKASR